MLNIKTIEALFFVLASDSHLLTLLSYMHDASEGYNSKAFLVLKKIRHSNQFILSFSYYWGNRKLFSV